MVDLISQVLSEPIEMAVKTIAHNAAWAWGIEQSIFASESEDVAEIVVMPNLGTDLETLYVLPGAEATEDFLKRCWATRHRDHATWRGFDVRHTIKQKVMGRYSQFDLFAALDAGARYLTQDAFDFITSKDIEGITLWPKSEDPETFTLHILDEEVAQLATSFRKQMVEAAAPYIHQIAAGVYVMNREPLEWIDRELEYDSLRLIIHPKGIFASFINSSFYVPVWWSPSSTNTAAVWAKPDLSFGIDVLLSCIWRDACIVRELWSEKTSKRALEAKGRRPEKHSNPIVFPRTIYRSNWANVEERAYIREQTTKLHAVRGCYPRLPEGWQPHDAAERAEEYGYPPPPEGHTFKRPHQRGTGEAIEVRRVVCRGLQVAKVALG